MSQLLASLLWGYLSTDVVFVVSQRRRRRSVTSPDVASSISLDLGATELAVDQSLLFFDHVSSGGTLSQLGYAVFSAYNRSWMESKEVALAERSLRDRERGGRGAWRSAFFLRRRRY